MSWSIDVIGDLEVKEPIVSMCCCEGNLALATARVGCGRLPDIKDRKKAIAAILKVIKEIDKKNSGLFNDDWCEICDLSWSNGREMEECWSNWEPIFSRLNGRERNLPFNDKKTCWGDTKRNELRSSAVRFYLYYKSGFEVTFTW